MIKAILWDVDGTILDFEAAEKAAIKKGFKVHHLGEVTDEMIRDYSKINISFWERLEKKELTKKEVLRGRFEAFFTKYNIPHTDQVVIDFDDDYQINLTDTICVRDDALNIIQSLLPKVRQGIITNGTKTCQDIKLHKTGLDELLKGHIYISEVVGHEKPSPDYFAPILEDFKGIAPEEILVVGDSLTSDIKGGINIGARTCWYNYKHLPNTRGVHPDFEIDDLHEVTTLIETSL